MKAGTQASTEPKNSTIPIKGLQYVISPSLPTPVQKHLNAMVVQDAAYNKLSAARTSHDTTSKEKKTNEQRPMPPHGTLPKLNGAYSALPLMGTYQINMLDITHGNCLDDPSFADTLSRIGPSARRLLQMEEDGKQEGDEGRGTQGGTTSKSRLNQSLPRPVDPPNPRSGSRASNRMSKTLGGTMGGTNGRSNVLKPFDGTSTFLRSHGATDKLGTGEAVAQPPKGATLHSTLSRRENVAHYNTAREVPLLESTLTRKPNLEPPLVATLRTYLEREVRLAQDGGVVPTVMDHLGPYREAFGALITAFPGYAGVLSDIRSAYDNVIQCQAALLSDAESKEELTIQQTAKHQEDTKALNTYIDELHRGLETMKTDFQHRESAMAKKLEQRYNADHSRIDNYELRRQLERADARSEELERNSRGDLQKIMVLIGAVRECDKRMKEFELTVKHMAGQVEELDEFKRLAGEAQTELQLYKEKFKAFIPSCDFQLMKDYLTDELAASRAMARRMRRTATVRGTQVDVLTRRLKQLEEEAHAEPREGSPLVSGIIPRTDGRLTPRPQWDHFHETLPELYEFSKDIHCNSLTSTKRHPEDRHDGEILVVDGPSGTTLQVEFLVERVNTLNQQVTQLDAERRAASTALQQLQAQQPPTGLPQDIMAVSVSSKPTSARGPSKARGANDGITTLANLHIYPIIGPGVSPNVPKHLRTTGIIERTVLEQGVSVRLVFDFFHNSLLPSFTNEILDAPALLFDFLTEALATREELGAFAAPAHIALNLMEDARDPHLTNPALFLLRNIMSGAMPVRLAVDAVAVLSHIITDLKAIAKEQQKARLRRQTISECLSPILELKPREELIDLRAALGGDTTFDTIYLTTISNRFMCTLFFQECQAGMDMYVEILRRLTTRAEPLNDQTGDSSISLSSVAEVVREVEPLTPEVVLREISVNAIGKIDEPVNPDAPEPVFALLSEVIKAIGVAPLIRRTIRGTREECAL